MAKLLKVEQLRDKTYNEAIKNLKKYGKCAMIRPTGFGKTGILVRIIKDDKYKKILYVYSVGEVKTAALKFYYNKKKVTEENIPNVTFMTYAKIARLDKEHIEYLTNQYDLIICDEYHRLGGAETMDGMNQLLKSNPKAHILGATATPERMDMVDITSLFFDDKVCSKYTLHDAIQDGIVKKPYYTFCAYGENSPETLARIKKDTMLQIDKLDGNDRKYATELLNARMIEISKLSRMEYVIEETLKEAKVKTSYQKYIVFCHGFNHITEVMPKVNQWFSNVFPNHEITETIITSENAEYVNNKQKLYELTTRKNTIDLFYVCEMLDEGYHGKDLTGIIMYRGTYSSAKYMQQLGRAIDTGASAVKVVFDVVDNIHRLSLYAMLGERTNTRADMSDSEITEYKELVKRTADQDDDGNNIPLTEVEMERLIELSKKFKQKQDNDLGKTNCSVLSQEDLIVTKYEATYKEFIAKTVAEAIEMRCRQAWERWLEKGGNPGDMTREHIISQTPPLAVPLGPFCKVKQVTMEYVMYIMGVKGAISPNEIYNLK